MLFQIVIPLVLMLAVLFLKKLPWIGGKIWAALALAGFAALLLGGVYHPLEWLAAWFDGLDRIAWIIGLSLLGGIYAQTQREIGAMETVLQVLQGRFGHSPRGLVAAVMATMAIAGALLGDAFAVIAVVGVLTIGAMSDLGLSGELITGILAIGSAMGSIMPPVTQSVFMSASILGVDPTWVSQLAYITVGTGIVIITAVVVGFFVKKDARMPEGVVQERTASQILREEWKRLIPFGVLTGCVICGAVPGGKLDFITNGLNLIEVSGQPLLTWLSGVPILKMFSNKVLLSLLVAILVTVCSRSMRGKVVAGVVGGVVSMKNTLIMQLGLAFMLGGFYRGGTIEAIGSLTDGLNSTALVIGGGAAELIVAMLTGSQAAAQSSVFVFLGPALVDAGFHPVNAAVFGSHLASGGQSALPTNLLVVMIAGMVSNQTGADVKHMKAMLYSCICAAWLVLMGFLVIFLPAWPFGA